MAASRLEDPFVGAIRLVLSVARRARRRLALICGFALPFHGVVRATGDVDFLAHFELADALDGAFLAAGARRLHRSDDAANYAAGGTLRGGVDLIFARRPRAIAMLERAKLRPLKDVALRVPVVDAEALIGLKLQALANDPTRRQDEADIEALLSTVPSLDVRLLRDEHPIVGPGVIRQDRLRPRRPVRDVDEFLEFLRRLHALFGSLDRPRRPTIGEHFRL